MANEQNLNPIRTESEAREKGQKGGIASGESRRARKTLRAELEALLSQNTVDKKTICNSPSRFSEGARGNRF